MKGWLVLADTGRPAVGSALNLLNAGWTNTVAMPSEGGTFTLPEQAVAVFLTADWAELNRVHDVSLSLADEDGNVAHLNPAAGGHEAVIRQQIQIPPTPGAPNGSSGSLSFMMGLDAGVLVVTANRLYRWRLHVAQTELAAAEFWVSAPPTMPQVGSEPPSPGNA